MPKLLLTIAVALVLTFPTTSHSDPILINVAGVGALNPGDLIASVGGPSRVGQYDDGSPAIVSPSHSIFAGWYSDVYRNEDRYTYLYGMTSTVCIDCGFQYSELGQSTFRTGALIGHRPTGQWGGADWQFESPALTANGFTFTSADASIFYLLSSAPPSLTGLLSGHFYISSGLDRDDPRHGPPLSFTATMPAYVPEQMTPVPEPGTLALLAVGLGSLIATRARKK